MCIVRERRLAGFLDMKCQTCSATCECAAGYVASPSPLSTHMFCFFLLSLCIHHMNRKSASCTRVSAVLHALAGLNPMSF